MVICEVIQCKVSLSVRRYEIEEKKRRDDLKEVEDNKADIGWGSQIRSYVLHPYQMVKDLRTEYTTSDTNGVLEGDINSFLEKSLIYFNSK